MIITTGEHDAPAAVERAMALAAKSGARFVSRNRTSMARLAELHPGEDILVVLEGGARLHRPGEQPMTFHPSMSFVRAKRLLKGEKDTMLEAAGVRTGDTIVDCTAGLGSDAIVFSLGAGKEGKVIAMEDSLPLWALLHEGFKYYVSGLQSFDESLRRIDLQRGHHLDLLQQMPDQSADVVYFDPMFRDPVLESSSISPLRSFANNNRLEEAAIAEACRVARRTVILKEKIGSGEFERLGFRVSGRARSKITYGVIIP
ncbi:class I SAM-dependent methyltransferase [Paenibacillus lentus]|uniref:SAM-dependent methyltransferase n=1 Tax=Paenibacillus lentus TaxID=1338368 RepID=A0A3Q8SC75_9BACL|nr:class I SAM-dependent methyltransferase [Paenibacillus lentus]AZK47353.1 SAM-dependent methyltransferase [Paenibacillus lentus]